MKAYVWGVVTGVLVLLAIPLIVFGTGMFNVAATPGPGAVEKTFASWVVDASVHWRAPDGPIPMEVDGNVLSSGLSHYRGMCLQCHGAPDVAAAEFAEGLNPPAPDLTETDMDDGELFWTIKNGIRMTGMPPFGLSHGDDEIWHLVAFIRHLPELTPAEKETLRESGFGGHAHGDGHADEHAHAHEEEDSGGSSGE